MNTKSNFHCGYNLTDKNRYENSIIKKGIKYFFTFLLLRIVVQNIVIVIVLSFNCYKKTVDTQ